MHSTNFSTAQRDAKSPALCPRCGKHQSQNGGLCQRCRAYLKNYRDIRDIGIKSPKEKFKELPVSKKLKAIEVLNSFLQNVNQKGYVAVDFYDGSIMYDFSTDVTTICDIDLFKKAPVINDKGVDWFGTKRLKAPEEYIEGCAIDEQTNIFTLGALIFEFFGRFSDEEIHQRYCNNQFIPCTLPNWQLSEESYQVATKAVSLNKSERYLTFAEFWYEWKAANSNF